MGGTPKPPLLVVPSLGISFGSFKHDMAKPITITAKIVFNSFIVTKPKAYTIPQYTNNYFTVYYKNKILQNRLKMGFKPPN